MKGLAMRTCRFWLALALASPLSAAPLSALADPVQDAHDTVSAPVENAAKASPGVSFVAMPIPVSNPAIGNGLGVGAILIYSPGDSPRPWTSGVGGLYTDSKTWAVAIFQKAYIDDDRFRVTVGGGGGVFNVKFYGIGADAGSRGQSIALEEDSLGGIAEVLVRVGPKIHVGLRYRGALIDTKIDLPQPPKFPDLLPPQAERKSAISQLGLSAEYDSRDNEYNPNQGIYAHGTWMFAQSWLGSDFQYDLLSASVNGYHRIDPDSLVAWRASICHAGDGAPFYDICNFGANNDLRGYPSGQFRDKAMFALQAEYRRHLFWRFGGVVFAGVGEVAPSFGKMSTNALLPAGGVGLRVEASAKYKVNASIDYAVGDHVSAVYFYIGEAF
jgi:outer membrane protein assembly factor BamA